MRPLSFAFLFLGWNCLAFAQQVSVSAAPRVVETRATAVRSAWVDLRQANKSTGAQVAPEWVESIKLHAQDQNVDLGAPSIFRIRLHPPTGTDNVLFVRLFFLDGPSGRPTVAAWDESRSQLLRSAPLGTGSGVDNSEAVMLPMKGVRAINIEAPGNGTTIRGVYLEWMASSELAHVSSSNAQALVPEPFSPTTRLGSPERDFEQFGTVTASLGAESIKIGPSADQAAVYEFGVESQPLVAMLTFEIAAARIDSPPEIAVNSHALGAAALLLPALADPGYRGEMHRMLHEMHFEYTGWLRAQILVPAQLLHSGTNEIAVLNGRNADNSVIRSTQIQLKYLWDKSDYILKPDR